jgi:hypothetical protein
MLKYIFTFFFIFVSLGAEDGIVDPEFYHMRTLEVDGHIYNYVLIEHSPSCPCQED